MMMSTADLHFIISLINIDINLNEQLGLTAECPAAQKQFPKIVAMQ